MKKNILIVAMMTTLMIYLSSCNLLKKDEIDPDKTLAKKGTTWEASALGMPAARLEVVSNDKGIATASIHYDSLQFEIKAKVTETQIYDFVYSDGDINKPFLLVDFDSNEGDSWGYNIGNQKVTRQVTHKSVEDDTFVGAFWMNVKVTEVTETVPSGVSVMGYQTGQVKQIIWKFNHKFGFISATIIKSDNSQVSITLDDTSAGS